MCLIRTAARLTSTASLSDGSQRVDVQSLPKFGCDVLAREFGKPDKTWDT